MLRDRILLALGCAAFAAAPIAAGQLVVDIGRGPVTVHIPGDYDPGRPAPLMLTLHGYTATGAEQEGYFGLLPLAEQHGFLYAFPDGTTDFLGNPFWNATDACCDLFGSGVDDATYLSELVDAIADQLSVDPWRVHFMGHSNGGFMSYRMACDHADLVASVASLAGATFLDPADCQPVGPVHVLQIHGTSDGTIGYNGGSTPQGTYPGAIQTVETWAVYDGCSLTPDLSAPNRDLESGIPGDESEVRIYGDQCAAAGSAQLWTIPGGSHVPSLSDGFRDGIVEFALSHPKAGLVFDDADTLHWPPLRWAESYRVYRGLLADLMDTDGDGVADPGYGACASATDVDPTDTTLTDTETPAPGSGYFYVLGFVDADGNESMLGTTGNGSPRYPTQSCP